MALEDYGLKTGLIPNGGKWVFMQTCREGSIEIEGSDADNLVQAVKRFRANAHIDLGDVEADVAAYIKQISPPNDKYPGKPANVPVFRPGSRPIIERLRDAILVIAPKKPVLLSVEEADERAANCLGCKHNVKWRSACAPCNEEVDYRLRLLRKRPSYHHDETLNACRLHDLPLAASVFISLDALPKRKEEAPSNCWLSVT